MHCINKSVNNGEQINSSAALSDNEKCFLELSQEWINSTIERNYTSNFKWMGRKQIQLPQDVYAIQELIWTCRPDLIIETGIAHGGSLIMSASMLVLLDYCDAVKNAACITPHESRRKVLGIDVDIRAHNRAAIEAHPVAHKINMIEGSSIDSEVIKEVKNFAAEYESVMVFFDSNHTHDHVFHELEAYAPLVSKGSYCVVFDTGIENLPKHYYADRLWGKGNNPKTAVWAYLDMLKQEGRIAQDGNPLRLEIDKTIEQRLVITGAPDGFLKRV
jgi:cephalosporin hydroxylase